MRFFEEGDMKMISRVANRARDFLGEVGDESGIRRKEVLKERDDL